MYRINKKYIIVDGYNYINTCSGFKVDAVDLETARLKLNQTLIEFASYSGECGIVVYDATAVPNRARNVELIDGIEVVYTRSGETADSYIECRVAEIMQDKSNQVRVVTQDWAEQLVVLGSGGLRLSAREWQCELSAMKRSIVEDVSKQPVMRNDIESIVDRRTIEKLVALGKAKE